MLKKIPKSVPRYSFNFIHCRHVAQGMIFRSFHEGDVYIYPHIVTDCNVNLIPFFVEHTNPCQDYTESFFI